MIMEELRISFCGPRSYLVASRTELLRSSLLESLVEYMCGPVRRYENEESDKVFFIDLVD